MTIHLRLTCLPLDRKVAVDRLAEVYDLISVSDPYPMRGSDRMRTYIEAAVKP